MSHLQIKDYKLTKKKETIIKVKYERKNDNIQKMRILGEAFVNKNKNKFKIIYDNKLYDINEFINYIDKNFRKKSFFSIKLKIIIGDMINFNLSHMFYKCESLVSLTDISKLNISNVTDINGMFYGCESLVSLPDISKWNTLNVNNMNLVFYRCVSLVSLTDISNWNTSNVRDISGMFYGCRAMISLPDISKWDTRIVLRM